MNRVASLLLGVGLAFPVLLKAGVDTAWVRRYDGPAHLGDYATCIAVDSQGNVVVAGVTAGADSTPDWVTIKYSSTGDSLWADRRSFTGNGKPLGMGVDTADNGFGNRACRPNRTPRTWRWTQQVTCSYAALR